MPFITMSLKNDIQENGIQYNVNGNKPNDT
jgi:hypothetical protein